MKMGKLLTLMVCFSFLWSCGDDGRDDTILDMSYLTGKDWYYNAWFGNKYEYLQNDVLQVVRFEEKGVLKTMDYGGRQLSDDGTWTLNGNTITLTYADGVIEKWNVLKSRNDYIETNVNALGTRVYVPEPDYLEDLTADAFLVNDYTTDGRYRTHIGADIRGNKNIYEPLMILSSDKYVALENHGYYWSEKTAEYVDFDDKEKEVRFYLRIGRDINLKLKDIIYGKNMAKRTQSEIGFTTTSHNSKSLKVTWNPYQKNENILYRLEIFSMTKDRQINLNDVYFASKLQPEGTSELTITANTVGEVNRVKDMKVENDYVVRLSAIMYEPGIDGFNDQYGYANIQAITYLNQYFVWK